MATQLILTVGKNPLPVWVAWDRLTQHWENKGQKDIAVQFVYTKASSGEKKRLKDYFLAAGSDILPDIPTDPRNPDMNDIACRIVRACPSNSIHLHAHYTGGTQAMGVSTVCAMLLAKEGLHQKGWEVNSIDASYLDPGRDSEPAIVSWEHDPLIEDTRIGITADIRKIAKINGFQAGGFTSKDPPHTCLLPQMPNEEKLLAGQVIIECIRQFETDSRWNQNLERWSIDNKFSKDHRKAWNRIFRHSGFIHPQTRSSFSLPLNSASAWDTDSAIWQNQILPALNAAYPSCCWDTERGVLSYPAEGSATDAEKKDLKQMDGFFNGIWLEYAAYAAFREVLEEVKCCNVKRENYELFHNVYIRQEGPEPAERHFELDVVAVLGYQVIVVSCSVTPSVRIVKQKAMEAYHRARQLGGVEARAVVLCLASYEDAERVEKELEDETGTERPLQVWGRQKGQPSRQHPERPAMLGEIPTMNSLRDKFRELLFDGYNDAGNPQHLHWK